MMHRRHFLAAGAASAAGLLGALSLPGRAAASDYRALVILHLTGGNDGNNMLIPTDGAYSDYQTARANLALPLASLARLSGNSAGHQWGLHSALAPLVPLYNQGRLAFLSNVGPLVQPVSAAQVISASARIPPFLMSHSDQQAITQGWTWTDDSSGWAGRALEFLPVELKHARSALATDNARTAVLGRSSAVSFLNLNGSSRWWGMADFLQPQSATVQAIQRAGQMQFANAYLAEYGRTLGGAAADSTFFSEVEAAASTPAADFGTDQQNLGNRLRSLASYLPVFKSRGLKRQVCLMHWGGFDTHANQRGSDVNTQDAQLAVLAKALAAFDATNIANGMDSSVVTLVMTEFGRTLRPGSGGGSEHAWGNHWFAFGGPVAGGAVIGTFPSLVLGGVDDGDPYANGRFVPTMAADQVGSSLMQWMGLPSNQVEAAFPYLANFSQKTVPLLR